MNLVRFWEFITIFTLGDKLNVINIRNPDLSVKNYAVQLHQMSLGELILSKFATNISSV